jgi:hypothetical protein
MMPATCPTCADMLVRVQAIGSVGPSGFGPIRYRAEPCGHSLTEREAKALSQALFPDVP